MKHLSAFWCDLAKKPFRKEKLVLIAGAAFVLAALGLTILWPSMRLAAEFLFALFTVFAFVLIGLLLPRLFGKVTDLHSAVLLYGNLRVAEQFDGGLLPDGAAANASLMLFLFKCLAMCRPQRILEFGSGQTTKLFAHYFHTHPGVSVCSVEHNQEWVVQLKPMLTRQGRVHDYLHCPLVERDFTCRGTGERVRTRWYSVPPELVAKQFDLILVDGPDTGPGVPYTRAGVLEHIPALLAEIFVVIFDDVERPDELMLARSFDRVLRAHHIPAIRFDIAAVKTQAVFCSPSLGFLRSV